jgi:hypothetical protein
MHAAARAGLLPNAPAAANAAQPLRKLRRVRNPANVRVNWSNRVPSIASSSRFACWPVCLIDRLRLTRFDIVGNFAYSLLQETPEKLACSFTCAAIDFCG